MNRYKIIFFTVALIVAIGLIYSLITITDSFSKTKFIDEPPYYNELFKKNENLLYEYTMTEDSIFPVSVYLYDKSNYGVIVFRRKLEKENILKSITFSKERKQMTPFKVYTSFLHLDELDYSFSDQKPVNKINFFIQGFNDSYIKEKTDERFYLSFPVNRTFAMAYNDSKYVDFLAVKKQPQKVEYNELMILVKKGYVYFIYLKPFRENKEERLILENLVL